MAKNIRIILFLLLTFALHGLASASFTDIQVDAEKHAISLSMDNPQQISTPEYPCTPVAELTNLQGYQLSVSRVQRMQLGEYFLSLKNALRCCTYRENSLSQHWGRIYNTTTSYDCQPSSEYYVFALRRIII